MKDIGFMNPTGSTGTISYMEDTLHLAKAVAIEAGDIMLDSFGLDTVHTLKADHSPLTAADTKVNALVIERIRTEFPEHSFLGEEGTQASESEYVWVFDPIDGTVPYMRGIPTNVFSLALVKDGIPILGVVYDPYMKRLYHAVKDGGAFMNDKPIHTSTRTDLSHTYIETDHHKGFTDLSILTRLMANDVRFLSYSSTVYGSALVASGQTEGVIFPGRKPWDAAAAKILIEEAGGTTSDITGNGQRYDRDLNGFIAGCTKEYHAKLLALISA